MTITENTTTAANKMPNGSTEQLRTTEMQQVIDRIEKLEQLVEEMNKTILELNNKFNDFENQKCEFEDSANSTNSNAVNDYEYNEVSQWYSELNPKLKALMNHYGYYSLRSLYRDLYIKFYRRFPGMKINDAIKAYKKKYGVKTCYTMKAIEDSQEHKEAFEIMINELIKENNLEDKLMI